MQDLVRYAIQTRQLDLAGWVIEGVLKRGDKNEQNSTNRSTQRSS